MDKFDIKIFEYNSKKYLEYINSKQYRLRESLLKRM